MKMKLFFLTVLFTGSFVCLNAQNVNGKTNAPGSNKQIGERVNDNSKSAVQNSTQTFTWMT